MNRSRVNGQRVLQNLKCFACQGFGHMASSCPNSNQNDGNSDNEQKKPKKNRTKKRQKKSGDQKQNARAAEDEPNEESKENSDDGDEFSALAMEEEPLAVESASLTQEVANGTSGDPSRWFFYSDAAAQETGASL